MELFNLGPFTISTSLGLATIAIIAAFAVGIKSARSRGTDAKRALLMILFVAIASARLAFVALYWQTYGKSPWLILDFRDGGMNIAVGIAGALVMTAFLAFRNQPLRKPLLASVLTGVILWAGAAATLPTSGAAPSLPQVALSNLDGRTVRIEALEGKPVVINLWATWCPPCRREMPAFMDAQQKNKDIVFVFANQGESVETVQGFLDSQRLAIDNVLLDPSGALPRKVGSIALPTTLFFDATGKLVDTGIGELSSASLAQRLQSLRAAR